LSRPEDYAAGVSLVVLRYTVLRLGLFVVVLAALFAAGARGLLLVGLTVVVSLALSYLLLRKQRDAMAVVIAERIAARTGEPHHADGVDEAAEDAEDDARRARLAAAQAAEHAREARLEAAQSAEWAGMEPQADSASPRPTSRP
jgi:hypothetical protein